MNGRGETAQQEVNQNHEESPASGPVQHHFPMLSSHEYNDFACFLGAKRLMILPLFAQMPTRLIKLWHVRSPNFCVVSLIVRPLLQLGAHIS